MENDSKERGNWVRKKCRKKTVSEGKLEENKCVK